MPFTCSEFPNRVFSSLKELEALLETKYELQERLQTQTMCLDVECVELGDVSS